MTADRPLFIIHGMGLEGRHALGYCLTAGADVIAIDRSDTCPHLDDTIVTNAGFPARFSYMNETAFLKNGPPLPGGPSPAAQARICTYLRSPGIAPANPLYRMMKAAGYPPTTPTGYWLARPHRRTIITVTGTKGKSTTTDLTGRLIRWCGHKAEIFGNIGAPPLGAVSAEDSIAVLELSSYMLHDLPQCRHHHVVTNLYKEHTDWHGSFRAYKEAKLSPLARGAPSLIGRAVAAQLDAPTNNADIRIIEDTVPQTGDTLSIGPHSITPHACNDLFAAPSDVTALRTAIAICRQFLNIEDSVLAAALETNLSAWAGLPCRREVIPTTDGITWVNDALATVPEATLAALERWKVEPVHLILGGRDRGQDLRQLLVQCARRGRVRLYVFGPFCENDLVRQTSLPCDFSATLEEAIVTARHAADKGDVILFSPAASSAPPHRSYRARADVFSALAQG